jgi:hypothetical protein
MLNRSVSSRHQSGLTSNDLSRSSAIWNRSRRFFNNTDSGTKDVTVQGWNGGVTLTKEDIKITRPTGLRHILFARGLLSKTIPLKKVVYIQYKADVSVAQMAFIRFVVPDMPPELEYKAALRDPYTVLIDKDQTTDFHTLYKEVTERVAHARTRKLS